MSRKTHPNRLIFAAACFSLAIAPWLPSFAATDIAKVSDFTDLGTWTFPAKSQSPDEFLKGQDAGNLELVLKLGNSKQWSVDSNANFRDVGVEAVGFNFRERTIYPLYPAEYVVSTRPNQIIGNNKNYKAGISPCHDDVDQYGYAKTGLAAKRLMGYSPCSSSLTKNYITTAVSGSLSHAIDSFTGSFLQHPARDYVVAVNPEAVTVAVISAKALVAAVQTMQDRERTEIASASTSADLRKVIQRYHDLDLTGQIPDVIRQEQIAHTSEYQNDYAAAMSVNNSEAWRQFTIKYQNFDPDAHLEAAQTTYWRMLAEENKERDRVQAEQKANDAGTLLAWRNTLAIGTHTHCGPVLDKRGTLVQVYFPVENYGNEHWLELDELYPPGKKNCLFLNGRYSTN